jgi:hypothetical protein
MPRYVILQHVGPRGTHFDFMLEQGDVLKTWELFQEPVPGCEILARPLPDHRVAYLDYEGPLSENRGQVTQWDRGTYELISESPSGWKVYLTGKKCQGLLILIPSVSS